MDAIFDWTDSEICHTEKGKTTLSEQEAEKREKALRMTMERTLASVEVYATLISRSS